MTYFKRPVLNKKRGLLLLILLFLFFLPFFWASQDLYNLGGDDSRLYVYSPRDWLKNISLNSWSPSGLTGGFYRYLPQHFFLGFNVLTLSINFLLPFLNPQRIILGLIFALSFLAVYLLVGELTNKKENRDTFFAQIVSGFFYVFLPINFSLFLPNPLHSLNGACAYPLLFLFFIKAIKEKKPRNLVWGAITSLVFSNSLMSIPFLLPFIIGSFIFLLLYFFLIEKRKKTFFKYAVAYIFLITLLNFLWLFPFLASNLQKNSQIVDVVSKTTKQSAIDGIKGLVSSKTNLLDHFSGFSNQQFISYNGLLGQLFKSIFKIGHLGIIFLIIILSAFLVKTEKHSQKRKILTISFFTFLWMTFLITVNIGNWGVKLFSWLIRVVPGFVAIRHFELKSTFAFSFFYAVCLGLALPFILSTRLVEKIKNILIFGLLLLVFLQGLPFITGEFFNFPKGKEVSNFVIKFPESFLAMTSYLKDLKDNSRVLTMPLSIGSYTIVKSSDGNGLYVGGSPIKVFTGRDDFNGQEGFENPFIPQLPTIVKSAFENDDASFFKSIFPLLNIRYVIYDSEIYNEDDLGVAKKSNYFIWIFKEDGGVRYEKLLDSLPLELKKTFGRWQVYKVDDNNFLPHFYIAGDVSLADESLENPYIPLSFEESGLKEVVFSPQEGNNLPLDLVDKIYISAQPHPKERRELAQLGTVRFLPDSKLYPFIRWRERRLEKKIVATNDLEEIIDLNLGLANKRLGEVEALVERSPKPEQSSVQGKKGERRNKELIEEGWERLEKRLNKALDLLEGMESQEELLRPASIKFLPNSLFYPFVCWKENRLEKKIMATNDLGKIIDLNLGLANKRLGEIEGLIEKSPKPEQSSVQGKKGERRNKELIEEGWERFKKRLKEAFRLLEEMERQGEDISRVVDRVFDYTRFFQKRLERLGSDLPAMGLASPEFEERYFTEVQEERKRKDVSEVAVRILEYVKLFQGKFVYFLRDEDFSAGMPIGLESLLGIRQQLEKKAWITHDELEKRYIINVHRGGDYTLFVEDTDNADVKYVDNADERADNADYFEEGPFKPLTFAIDGKVATVSGKEREDNWLSFGQYQLEEGKHKLQIFLPRFVNLAEQENFTLSAKKAESFVLPLESFLEEGQNFNISFDYKIEGESLPRIIVAQKIKVEGKDRVQKVIDTILPKSEYKLRFIKSFTIDPTAKQAGIKIFFEEYGDSRVLIENFQVTRDWRPRVVLRTTADNPLMGLSSTELRASRAGADEERRTPKITFRRVNPTRYEVEIEEAEEPFLLVFSESFHPGWRVYADMEDTDNAEKIADNADGEADNADTVVSYFGGEIEELQHKNDFVYKGMFDTWGKKEVVPKERHLLINGYANSWYIETTRICADTGRCTENADGSYDMKLIVEFWPQRLFYIGLGVSGLTLVGCLSYLVLSKVKYGR